MSSLDEKTIAGRSAAVGVTGKQGVRLTSITPASGILHALL